MKLKSKLISSGLITAVTCALVGSITGTFAWYGYSTRATATLTGTSIYKAANLQLGIVTDLEEVANPEYDAVENPDVPETIMQPRKIDHLKDPENNICWAPIGGGLKMNAINAYLQDHGFSTNEMRPSTSGRTKIDVANPEYDAVENPDVPQTIEKDADILPKEMSIYQYNGKKEAKKSDYIILPLAIRVSDLREDFLPDRDIFLSNVDVSYLPYENNPNPTSTLRSGLRIDFKTWNNLSNIKHVILNPGSDQAIGRTPLGGLLDINRDGYVDVEEIDYEYKPRQELLYGAINEDKTKWTMKANPDYDPEDPESEEFLNEKELYATSDVIAVDAERPIHVSKNYDERNHQINTYTVKSYEAYEQEWRGALLNNGSNGGLIAKFSSDLRLEHGEALCNTGAEKLVYCTLTIWLEGWDDAINETTLGVEFGLGLQFQIDRVD